MKEMFSNVPHNAPAVVFPNEYSGEVTVSETVLLSFIPGGNVLVFLPEVLNWPIALKLLS